MKKNKIFQNQWDAVKAVIRGNFYSNIILPQEKKKIQTPKAVRIEQATFKVIYRKQIIKDQSRKKSRQSKL